VRAQNAFKILLTPGCLIVSILILVITITPLLAAGIVGLAMIKGEGVVYDWYNGPFAQWLGLGCATGFQLSESDLQKISAIGIPANAVANAEAARRLCGIRFGSNIDIGMILAIMDLESGYGSKMGHEDWLVAINSNRNTNHASEIAAAEWLLDRWQTYNVRSTSSDAERQIYPGYSGYFGHPSAGEIGDGFLPTTAKFVCERLLMDSGDQELESCNFFSRKVSAYAISWYLYRGGYSADQSSDQKIASLYTWNHNLKTRGALLDRAKLINVVVGAVNIISDVASVITEPGKTLFGDLRSLLIIVLDSIGLLPERVGWLEMPLRQEDLNKSYWSDGISQDYMETTYDSRGHPAIDYVCRQVGIDVIAVANGVVIEPDTNTLMGALSITQKGSNFGNNVWIDHGGGLYALYAHLNSVDVNKGDKIVQGQVIGTCGSTGNSTGPHVHFQVLNVHPNQMQTYRQTDPGNINPHDVLGTCFTFKKEE